VLVTFKGQNLTIPDSIRTHAQRRAARLDRYLSDAPEMVLELRKEETRSAEDRYIAQATLSDEGRILRAEERARDMEQAVDAALETLGNQARRHHARRRRRGRVSLARSIGSEAENAAEDLEDEVEDEVEEASGRVVRVKRFAMKPMTLEEAIDQAELLGHDFFLFFSAEENRHALLYRRRDEGYGLIVPDGG
jgi:putative sigma-54 modulation protein